MDAVNSIWSMQTKPLVNSLLFSVRADPAKFPANKLEIGKLWLLYSGCGARQTRSPFYFDDAGKKSQWTGVVKKTTDNWWGQRIIGTDFRSNVPNTKSNMYKSNNCLLSLGLEFETLYNSPPH